MNGRATSPRLTRPWLSALFAGMFVLSACAGGANGPAPKGVDASAEEAIDRAQVAKYNYVDVDFIPQTREVTCGLAAFASVARTWDIEISQNDEYMAFPPMDAIRGYSVEELKYVIESRGFYVFAVRGDDAFLRQQIEKGRPVIVPLRKVRYQFRPGARTSAARIHQISTSPNIEDNLDHFVVVIGYGDGGYLILDPDDGFAVLPTALFAALRTPHHSAALLIAPGADAKGKAQLREWRPTTEPRRAFGAATGLNAVKWASDEDLKARVTGRQ